MGLEECGGLPFNGWWWAGDIHCQHPLALVLGCAFSKADIEKGQVRVEGSLGCKCVFFFPATWNAKPAHYSGTWLCRPSSVLTSVEPQERQSHCSCLGKKRILMQKSPMDCLTCKLSEDVGWLFFTAGPHWWHRWTLLPLFSLEYFAPFYILILPGHCPVTLYCYTAP